VENGAAIIDAEQIPGTAFAAPAAPKFCRICGTPWQADQTNCQNCSVGLQRNALLLDATKEQHATKSAISLFLTLLAVCAIGILVGTPHNGLTVQINVSIALSVVTLIWCIASWRTVLPLLGRFPNINWFAAALGLSLITYAIGAFVIGAFQSASDPHGEQLPNPFLAAGYGWSMVILVTCVQPAIIEELAFRGVILGALQKALRPMEAVAVSALMFMILHLSFPRFPHTLALGLAAGLIRTRTRSLYPCMLLHFSHNLLCVAAEWMHR
jgi:uncharacterized protein